VLLHKADDDERSHEAAHPEHCEDLNSATKFRGMPGAPFTWTKSRLRARDRLRRLRASDGALFAFSAKTRCVGTIAFVGKANAKKADESGFPDEGKNFPDRPI
jgi:hypothetical protein